MIRVSVLSPCILKRNKAIEIVTNRMPPLKISIFFYLYKAIWVGKEEISILRLFEVFFFSYPLCEFPQRLRHFRVT